MTRPLTTVLSALVTCGLVLVQPAEGGPTADLLRSLDTDVPTPKLRPPGAPRTPPSADRAADRAADRPFEDDDGTTDGPASAETGEGDDDEDGDSTPTAADAPRPQGPSACLVRLAAFTDAVAVASPVSDDPGCTIEDAVRLSRTGSLSFGSAMTLDCAFAEAFATFARDTAAPLAATMGTKLTALVTGPGYQCRRRNRSATGKLSEHAFGNAVDIMGFAFEGGRRLQVVGSQTFSPTEERFFTALRKAACGHFTTVLGPGSNAAHADHLHFDLGRTEEGRKNPYRICE